MAASAPGSRTGLIVWSVVATILFAVSSILAIVSYVNGNNERKLLEGLRARYQAVVPEGEITRYSALGQRAGGRSWLEVAVTESTQLTQLLTGQNDATPQIARDAVTTGLVAAQKSAGDTVAVPVDNVVVAISTLSGRIDSLTADLAKSKEELAIAQKTITANIENQNKLLAVKDQEVADANDRIKVLGDDSSARHSESVVKFNETSETDRKTIADQLQQINSLSTRIASLEREKAGVLRERDAAIAKVTGMRGPTDQIVRAIDGKIVRVLGDRVFINLGTGNQVAPGLTFEVYSSLGIPTVGPDASQDIQLEGKASIQVINVQQGTSECKVLRVAPGQVVNEGDAIANLAYDKNLAYNFYVFGKYNLDNKGEPTERDTEIIKRLVTQFGSKVGDQISTATDFVVIGAEPVVPNFSQQEMDEDPLKAYQMTEAIKQLDEYNAVRAQAIQLNIPLLNQNRFLHLVGYYSESQR